MAFAETQHLTVQLDLKGNLNAGLGKAQGSLRRFDAATQRSQRAAGNLGRNVVIGAGLAAAGIGLLVKSASEYESAFAGVRKTVDATEPELKKLSEQFRAMSREIPITAAELASLGEAGGALGVPTDQLAEFVRVTALLGVTTDLSAGAAADALGVLGNVLQLTGSEYSKFASSLVALGNAGASTESQIVGIAQRVGATGRLVGVSTPQVLGFASAVASLGIEVEAGGSSLQKFFIDTAKAVSAGGKDLKLFAKVTGVSAKTFKTSWGKDAGGTLQKFLAGLGKLKQGDQLAVLANLGFNDVRITRTLLGLANNTKLVADQMGVANKAFDENTALTKEAEQRFATFDSQLQITKNTLTDMGITIGSKLLPKITPLLKRLNEFVNANTGGIEKFGDELASSFEKVAGFVSSVDFGPFIEALKISSAIAKQAVDIFLSLPKGVQTALITGLAINKLTGGLPGALAKDIGGMVFGALKAMTVRAGVVNVTGGIVNGGGGGGPGAPGVGLKGAGLLASIGLTTATLLPLTVGLIAAAGLSVLLDNAINEKGGLPKVGEDLTKNGLTLGTGAAVLDPSKPKGQNTFLGGKGSNLVLVGAKVTIPAPKAANVTGSPIPRLAGSPIPRDPKTVAAIKASQAEASRKAAEIKAANIATASAARDGAVAGRGTSTAVYSGTSALVAAIGRQPTPIVNVKVNVTPSQIIKQTTIQYRYGAPNGSGGSSGRRAGAQVS